MTRFAGLALKLKPLIAARAKEKQQRAGKQKLPQNSAEAIETRNELARIAGVSHDTIAKANLRPELCKISHNLMSYEAVS